MNQPFADRREAGAEFPAVGLWYCHFSQTTDEEVHKLLDVRGATHLFDEPGTLEQVMELAANWFDKYLR
jgi:hypothetical protein